MNDLLKAFLYGLVTVSIFLGIILGVLKLAYVFPILPIILLGLTILGVIMFIGAVIASFLERN
jgi:hypothetical protein